MHLMTKIMKIAGYLVLLVCCLTSNHLWGQSKSSASFRQYVNYRIDVRLDDTRHELHGKVSWEYINRSPDTLRELYVHLWPNAYVKRNTAFGLQKLRFGETGFYFAPEDQLGGIDSLDFNISGQAVRLEPYQGQADVGVLKLAEPLKPGTKTSVTTTFRVRIPASFSRLGHIGESYQITQWFPKPAVYDQNGWHPMPYLDAGEFYSEFGAFDVYITIPDNYQVAATGVLQNQDERFRLRQVTTDTRHYLDTLKNPKTGYVKEAFPPSAPGWKILHYHADNVHDFAWFADKRFKVLQDTLVLPSGREITAAVFFTQTDEALWKNALDYVKRSTRFYAEKIGDYPYPHVTAVQSALSAGGGMEYPMITVIGQEDDARALDQVLAHEVGHNWFYGILASNERDHAWMDEGFNSYYEQRYMRAYYPEESFDPLPLIFTRNKPTDQEMALWEIFTATHADQVPNTNSDELRPANYLLGAYIKPALALAQWEGIVGQAGVDKAMQAYYRNWQFKHPQPLDLRKSLEQASGEDLGWFFEGFMNSEGRQDYAIVSADLRQDSVWVKVRNKGEVAGPFPIDVHYQGGPPYTQWHNGFTGEKTILLLAGPGATHLTIDANRQTLEANRNNNYYRLSGPLARREPLRLRLLAGFDVGNERPLYLMPLVGWNQYDKTMLGMAFHGGLVPAKPFEWYALPMYSFGAKTLTGTLGGRYRWYPSAGPIERWELSANASRFHYNTLEQADAPMKADRLTAALRADLATPAASSFSHALQLKVWQINQQTAEFSGGEYVGLAYSAPSRIGQVGYSLSDARRVAPYQLRLALEYQTFEDVFEREQDYLKLMLEASGSWLFQPRKRVSWRVFAGYFPRSGLRGAGFVDSRALSLVDAPYTDYRFDQYFMGRSESEGLSTQQIGGGQGGFHTAIGPGFMTGRSNHYLLALNLATHVPFMPSWFPLRPWLDAGYYDEDFSTGRGATFLWSAGLGLEWMGGRFSVYLPLVGSEELMNPLSEKGGFPATLSFKMQLHQLTPWAYLENFLNQY